MHPDAAVFRTGSNLPKATMDWGRKLNFSSKVSNASADFSLFCLPKEENNLVHPRLTCAATASQRPCRFDHVSVYQPRPGWPSGFV
jgi:hypothetical protein